MCHHTNPTLEYTGNGTDTGKMIDAVVAENPEHCSKSYCSKVKGFFRQKIYLVTVEMHFIFYRQQFD